MFAGIQQMFSKASQRNHDSCACMHVQVLAHRRVIFFYKKQSLLWWKCIVFIFSSILVTCCFFIFSCYSCWWCVKGMNTLIIYRVMLLLDLMFWCLMNEIDALNTWDFFNLFLPDLWFWCLKVPLPYNTHVISGHFSMDGPRSYPKSPSVWNMWHVLVWSGECLSFLYV